MEGRSPDGSVTYALGKNPEGFIIYAPDGYMSALLFNPERELFGTPDRLGGTESQLAAAARGCISYAGPYELHGTSVRHVVQASLMPDWIGTTLERNVELQGQRLTLTTPATMVGGKKVTTVLVWERVPEVS
jgi:hypothetical protein